MGQGEGEGEAPGPLTIVLSCPKCGAPCSVDDETVSLRCEHCTSLLILSAPGRDEIYLQGSVVQSEQQILETVIMYRVNEQRAEIVSLNQDAEGNAPPEAFIAMRLRSFEEKLRATARLLRSHWVYGPYWHITGKILQVVLGRAQEGPKELLVRAFAVEHSLPGYDTRAADLRDRGLRLRRSKVEPLTVRRVQETGPFLTWVPISDGSHREIEKWCMRDLLRGVEPISKHGEFLFGRRILVYRPYCVAQVELGHGPKWVLLDAGFGTIAGYPTEAEVKALLKGCGRDPLGSARESYRRVATVPARCPDCGFEQELDRRHCLAICTNCHRGLEPLTTGIRLFSYDHAETSLGSSAAEYVPFWRYSFSVEPPAGEPLRDLDAYRRSVFQKEDLARLPIMGDALWVPAFRLLGTEIGDEVFAALSRWIHREPPTVRDGRVPLHQRPRFWGASLPESEARLLGRYALLAVHDKQSAARLSGILVKQHLLASRIQLFEPRLVMVPLVGDEKGLDIPTSGGRIPKLLLAGGPQLDALRESVHRQWTRPA